MEENKFREANMEDVLMYERWFDLMARLRVSVGCLDNAAKIFQKLYDVYTHKSRAYHNLKHIKMCLDELDCFSAFDNEYWDWDTSFDEVKFALWWHDFSDNNEELSAERAADNLKLLGLGNIANKISELIKATDHKNYKVLHRTERINPDDVDLICDVDLTILGQQKEIFNGYEKDVRREYVDVPDSVFREKRAEILQKFLDRPRIYRTDYFYNKYENPARENLQRSIARLTGK